MANSFMTIPLLACAVGMGDLAAAQGTSEPEAPPMPSSTLRRRAARPPTPPPPPAPQAAPAPAPAPAATATAAPTSAPAPAPDMPASDASEPPATVAPAADAPAADAPAASADATPQAGVLPGWTAVKPPPADAPLVSIAPGAFPPTSVPASIRMHFANHGSRVNDRVGAGGAIPNGQAWWYAQDVGPGATPSNNVYSYFGYVPPVNPNAAAGVDLKFWSQDGVGFGQFGWDPYNMGGSNWVGGFD